MSLIIDPVETEKSAVSAVDVGKEYLRAELSKADSPVGVPEDFEQLTDQEIIGLVQVHSERRGNAIFRYLDYTELQWEVLSVAIEEISLTKVNSRVNPLLIQCEFNLERFVEALKIYFFENPNSDPSGLNEFRPDLERTVEHTRLIAIEKDDEIIIIDGIHRAVSLAMNRAEEIEFYVGKSKI